MEAIAVEYQPVRSIDYVQAFIKTYMKLPGNEPAA